MSKLNMNSNFIGMCNSSLWCLAPQYAVSVQHSLEQYLKASLDDRIKLEAFLNKSTQIGMVKEVNYHIIGNTLVYPIIGHLVPRVTDSYMAYLGYIGTLDIMDDLESLFTSNVIDNIDKVIFYIDGPGGVLTGVPELADLINRISKSVETIAFSNNAMASAHYYLGAATGKIITTKSTIVGSIGIIFEVTKFNYSGSNTILFTKGEYKAAGHPAKNLDAKEIKFFEELISHSYTNMVADIAKYRNKSEQDVIDTQGAYMQASMNEWFVDGMVNSFNELILNKT